MIIGLPSCSQCSDCGLARCAALNARGISVAAWALAAQGLENLVVWLGVMLREGAATASLGVALGVAIVGLASPSLRQTGLTQLVPPFVLDSMAAIIATVYGLYFLRLAAVGEA